MVPKEEKGDGEDGERIGTLCVETAEPSRRNRRRA